MFQNKDYYSILASDMANKYLTYNTYLLNI